MSVIAPVSSPRQALRLVSRPSTNHEALVVLAKATGRGIGKTRLANDVGVEAAAELAEAFLADTIALSRASGREVTIAFTPVESRAEFSSIAPEATLVAQLDGDLGERIGAALSRALQGRGSAVLVGSDTPQLPRTVIEDAFQALKGAEMVVGPATDGGFYLIGLTAPESLTGLFDGIDWSTCRVFQQLLQNARRLCLTVQVLDAFTDIDDAISLAAVLRYSVDSQSAHLTRAAALRLGLELA